MALTLIEAPQEEPVSLEGAKIFLKVDHKDDDLLIQGMIKTSRKAVEAYTGRCLLAQGWSFTLNSGYALSLSDEKYLEGQYSRGKKGIEIPKTPFMQLNEDPVIIDIYGSRKIEDYRVDSSGRVAKIHFGPSITAISEGKGVLQIQFKAGYGSRKEDVPEPFVQAILIMMANLYENRGPVNDNFLVPPLMPQAAADLIQPYRFLRLN